MKNRCKKRHGNRKARKLDFYGFLMILEPFCPPKTEPRWPKIDVERASKFDQFWKPLGTRLFRPKRRQEAPAPQIAAEDGVSPGLLGKDLGWGNKNLSSRTGRYQELAFGRTGDLDRIISHADPGWAAD